MADKLQKLSQAIRLGATFRPQGRGSLFGYGIDGVLHSCAIGAAFEAIGGLPETGVFGITARDAILQRFPDASIDTTNSIITQNDTLHWSREEIADKLEAQGL